MDENPIESILIKKPLSAAVKVELCRRFEKFCWQMTHEVCRRSGAAQYGNRDDWFQEAVMELIGAGDRYDWTKGANFITYATIRVRWRLRNRLRSDNGLIRTPVKKLDSHVAPVVCYLSGREYPFVAAPCDNDQFGIDVDELLKLVSPDVRSLLRARYAINGGATKTHAEIAAEAGVSRQRVQQIERQAFEEIRRKTKERAII